MTRVLDADSSDEETNPVRSQLNADSSDEEGDSVVVGKKGKVIDSSDEEGLAPNSNKNSSQLNADSSDEEPMVSRPGSSTSDQEKVTSKLNVSAMKSAIDSDDDDSDSEGKSPVKFKSKKSKIRKALDSEDESNDDNDIGNKTNSQDNKVNLLKNKDLYDAESSDGELPDIPKYPVENESDNESGKEEDNSDDEGENGEVSPVKDFENGRKGGSRKSAQAAMMEIRSESARLTRESAIGLPYHRPKQRSLEEFLNRKKGTPDALKSINLKRFDSNIDNIMKEREQKLKDFFKADSEEENNVADDEEDDEDKDYNPLNDNTEAPIDEDLAAPELLENTGENDNKVDGIDEENDSHIERTDSMNEDMEIETEDGHHKNNVSLEEGAGNEVDNKNSEEILNENHNIEKSKDDSLQPAISAEEKTDSSRDQKEDNDPKDDSLKLELVADTESMNISDAAENEEDSLKLVFEPDTVDESLILSSQAQDGSAKLSNNKAWSRIQALKNKLGDKSDLESTLNITPRLRDSSDQMILLDGEESEHPKVSTGAQKLIEKFYEHAKALKSNKKSDNVNLVEDVKIVSKKIIDGKEVLVEEVVKYHKDEKKENQYAGRSFISFKEKLKMDMMKKKKEELSKRREILKMNNEEGFEDELPEDDVVEDEEYENYDEEEDEDEEGESEPEEEDVLIVDKKSKKSLFVDDEAEDEDEDDQEDEDSMASEDILPQKRSQFRKIIQDPELMSESSNQSDIFNKLDRIRCDAETPTLNNSKADKNTSAPSSNLSLASVEARWTPFQDRTNNRDLELTSAENSLNIESPTQSQMAKKKLGFEGLFDATDPDVTDIDDVIGLCSGQFATQPGQADHLLMTQSQNVSKLDSISLLQDVSKNHGLESQDTVILTVNNSSRPASSCSNILDRISNEPSRPQSSFSNTQDDTVILNQEDAQKKLNESIKQILGSLNEDSNDAKDDDVDNVGHGVINSDDEEASRDVSLKVSKKRKGRLLSDSEDSADEKEENDDDENKDENVDHEKVYDSEENEVIEPVKKPKQKMFDKKGKLRKDFYDEEAELSDEEGGGMDLSDDEDERNLDRFEMEEGDLDDIDEHAEREKVGRIHQRVLLDEDQAELRLFQEKFLEDGDLHTDYKRTKQFRWAGLDDNIEVGPSKDEEGDGAEEEETLEKWRLEKMEKEKWIQEFAKKQSRKRGHEDEDDLEDENDGGFFKMADKTLMRMTSKEDSVNPEDVQKNSNVFKSPNAKFGPLQPLHNMGGGRTIRGSFIARGEKSLDKIAQFHKQKDDRVGSGVKGNNFVFARISPVKEKNSEKEETATKKSATNRQPPAKKPRVSRTLDGNSKGTIFNLL